jgi:hypothetical protein
VPSWPLSPTVIADESYELKHKIEALGFHSDKSLAYGRIEFGVEKKREAVWGKMKGEQQR